MKHNVVKNPNWSEANLLLFFNREKNNNKNDKHDVLINKVNVHVKASI